MTTAPETIMPQLDVDYVRGCFPAFQQPLPAKTAFFENAGGSYVAGTVLERYFHFYTANKVQPYGASRICEAAGEQMDAGRQAISELLGVPASTLTIGPSTTQNFNTLAVAATAIVEQGSAVIVTAQDHESNIGAWQRLCERQQAELRIWPVNAEGELTMENLLPLVDDRVKVLCMTQSSNIIGSINPVTEVIKLVRPRGIRVVVDGVSYAPHQWPAIPDMQPDAYCFSTYKTWATHLGVMYVSEDFAARLDPQCHYFNIALPEKRFDAAGPDHGSIAALAGLGEYFAESYAHHFAPQSGTPAQTPSLYDQAQQVSTLMHDHETTLCQQFLDGIADLPLSILGRATMEGREANIAMHSSQYSSAELSKALGKLDIAAGNGHFYARRLLDASDIADSDDGILRVSFSHYNTADDTARVVNALTDFHS